MNIKKLKSLIILFKTHQHLTSNVKLSLSETELTVNEFTVLEALYTKGELSVQELIDKILIPNSSMTYVLDVLEKKNYIERKKDKKDRRRQQLSLTSSGTTIFLKIYDIHYNHMTKIFEVLTPEEEVVLRNLLKKIGKKAQELSV